MKKVTFTTKLLLCATILLGNGVVEIQASQSWYDWGTSGISSAMSSMRGLYNQLPSISMSMTNLVNSMSQITKEKLLVAISVSLLGTAGATALYKWYQKYKQEQERIDQEEKINECIADINSIFEGIKNTEGNIREFSREDRYDIFIKRLDTPAFFQKIIDDHGKNIFVIAMNQLLNDYYYILGKKGPLPMLKINKKGNIIKEFIEGTEEEKQPILEKSLSPKEENLYNNIKKSCELSSDADKYACVLITWKNHIEDTWWNEDSQKNEIYDGKTIANVVNKLLRDYYPMSEQRLRNIDIKQINFLDVASFRVF